MFTRGRSPKISVKVYWQVSACCGTFSAAKRYRLQATNVSAKKTARAVATKIAAKTLPHMLVSLDPQVLRDSQVLRDTWVLTSNVTVAGWLSMAKVLRLIEVSL